MSRGARGGGSTGVRAVASALGIARQDVGSYMRLNQDPPPLYPVLFASSYIFMPHLANRP